MENDSLKAYVLSEVNERRKDVEPQKLAIPRFPRLLVRYAPVDPRKLLGLSLQLERAKGDEVTTMLAALADLLVEASVGAETDRGEDLGVSLGKGLADFLGVTGPDGQEAFSDQEAVFLLFDDDIALVKHANRLRQLLDLAAEQEEAELVGNSSAAS